MKILYTDFDPLLCRWLENLIAGGFLAEGDVLCRDVRDIALEDVRAYDTIHWFCGIGGWPLALELAGWPEDLPVFTASLPCQPFSIAGKKRGEEDERHLWPVFRELVAELAPPVIFGEQVASPLGRQWLAAVRSDLEKMGYAVGAADLPAAAVGAPHMRHRLWWGAVRLADATRIRQVWSGRARRGWDGPAHGGALGHTDGAGLEGHAHATCACQWPAWTAGPEWLRGAEWWLCGDGKLRPFEPGVCPVADGFPGRVGMLRAAGNAIVPQVGAVFVEEFMEAFSETNT